MTDWGLLDPGAADASGTSDDAVLAAMVDVERALLRAWGSVLDEVLDPQSDALDAVALDRDALREGVARDGVPVVALVPALRAQLESAGLPAGRLHLGATSQDVVDTALMLVARDALRAARGSLVEAGRALIALADAHRRDLRMARSIARHGEASTLGVLAAGWLDGVTSAIAAVDALVFPVQFGGAVGTGTAADAAAGRPTGADEVRGELASRLGLTDPGRSWHTERTPALAVAAAAATVIAALGRIAGDATLLSREELGEVRLAAGGGSSAMPHKQNPVDALRITAAAVEAPGLLSVVATAAIAGDERPPGRWHAEWSALRRLVRLARSSAGAASRLVGGLGFAADRAAAIVADAGLAGERPDRDVLAAASDRIVGRAVARFTRAAGPPAAPRRHRRPRRPRPSGEPPVTVPRLLGSFAPGTAPGAANPLLVLLPSLGTTTALWDGVVARLRADERTAGLRILRIDLPGHGVSPAAREPFTVGELADAVLAVVDEAGGGAFHVAGVSLGGAIALELAVAHSGRVRSLALSCSGARIGTPDGWAERAGSVRASGTASLVTGSASRWFAPGFLDREGGGPGARSLTALVDVDDESYARCAEALASFDRSGDLGGLGTPTLAISGEHDAVTTPASMQELAAAIPSGRHVMVSGASHLAVLEDPATTAGLIAAHVDDAERAAAASAARDRGMRVRREVLGDPHVDRAVAATTPETAPFQDFITRYAWGEVWARPGLTRRERSIATLASLTTGGHENEIAMHVRAALRNGLTRDEIAEVLLHTALYAGLPAANSALGIAREVFAGLDADAGPATDAAESPVLATGAPDDPTPEEHHG